MHMSQNPPMASQPHSQTVDVGEHHHRQFPVALAVANMHSSKTRTNQVLSFQPPRTYDFFGILISSRALCEACTSRLTCDIRRTRTWLAIGGGCYLLSANMSRKQTGQARFMPQRRNHFHGIQRSRFRCQLRAELHYCKAT